MNGSQKPKVKMTGDKRPQRYSHQDLKDKPHSIEDDSVHGIQAHRYFFRRTLSPAQKNPANRFCPCLNSFDIIYKKESFCISTLSALVPIYFLIFIAVPVFVIWYMFQFLNIHKEQNELLKDIAKKLDKHDQ
ncbi:hypothetical protein M3N64_08485 [Sporolactobacillus sp. CPB3-1]|uniref:Uncharacterized protein n=1 Tax=Sporolactobacillus mangiferae TaxID=2940498 RepID=A0ABT0MCI7_9BACL|nr:hypothetical protein [Sporolactobacillus mangiferae]MCL1631984.1 hypothetical protein [Sporolactobacillus mangiferae]